MLTGASQGEQDARLRALFAELAIHKGTYVEFGFPPTEPGSSIAWFSQTDALRKRGWTGIRLDAENNDPAQQSHAEWIYSTNIVALFRKYGVLADVDYVSIDIDSADLWVLRALLESEYQPKVLTVEYNSNFPWNVSMAYPDPAQRAHLPPNLTMTGHMYNGDCFMGSSARAIHQVALAHGYVTVDVEPGLDIFLVRASLWTGKPVPELVERGGRMAFHAVRERNPLLIMSSSVSHALRIS